MTPQEILAKYQEKPVEDRIRELATELGKLRGPGNDYRTVEAEYNSIIYNDPEWVLIELATQIAKLKNAQISGGTPSDESDCYAGDCTTCGGPVFHRNGKPGEYDHRCKKPNTKGQVS